MLPEWFRLAVSDIVGATSVSVHVLPWIAAFLWFAALSAEPTYVFL